MPRLIAAVIAALFLAAPLAASAQNYGPSYAGPGGDDAQIHGRILNFDGAYGLQVRDERGYVDNVQLHQGTIINPTGLTLAPGMIVSIMGYNAGPFFAANEVDTPYTFYAGYPYYQGHPWSYYGPSVSLGFFFGNSGWWHGRDFDGGYHYDRGARVYQNARPNEYYRGGAFQGRNYVAPQSRGGYDVRAARPGYGAARPDYGARQGGGRAPQADRGNGGGRGGDQGARGGDHGDRGGNHGDRGGNHGDRGNH